MEVSSSDPGAAAAVLHEGLSLGGPLFRAMIFEHTVTGARYLVLVAHHLVVDSVSWQIIEDDLHIILRNRLTGDPSLLAPAVSPFVWAERLDRYANSDVVADDIAVWAKHRSGAAKYLSSNPALTGALAAIPKAEVLFNYLGNTW